MRYTVRSTDLRYMSESERNKELTNLVQAAKQGHQTGSSVLDARIKQFEMRYEMSSDTMRKKVSAGEMRETAEIAGWLFWLKVRERHVTR